MSKLMSAQLLGEIMTVGQGLMETSPGRSSYVQFDNNGTIVIDGYTMIDNILLDRNHTTKYRALKFVNTVFDGIFSVDKTTGLHFLTLEGCTISGKVSIASTMQNLTIQNSCVFKDEVEIIPSSVHDFTLSDSVFEKTLLFEGQYHQAFNISKIQVKEKLTFSLRSCDQKFSLDDLSGKSLTINKGDYFKQMDLKLCNFDDIDICKINAKTGLELFLADSKKVKIASCKVQYGLKINRCVLETLNIESGIETGETTILESHIKKHVLLSLTSLTKVWLYQLTTPKLIFGGNTPAQFRLDMYNNVIDMLDVRNFINKGDMRISGLGFNTPTTLNLIFSDLGHAEFFNCDFTKGEFNFSNSKVSDLFLAHTDFNEEVKDGSDPSFKQAQLAFGQLSTAFARHGDNVRTVEYHARELRAHFHSLSWIIQKKPYFNFTKLNLGLNKLSNDFGRDWMRGVAFTISAGLIFFICLVLSLKGVHINLKDEFDPRFVGYFLKFLNPIRLFEPEKIFEPGYAVTFSTLSVAIDFFSRLLLAYGFYQTIQAFRKFGKQRD